MTFKKTVVGALLCGLLAAVPVQAQMKIATDSGAKGSPNGDAIEKWSALIEEGTQGQIKTRVFYQNQLGGQEEVFDQHLAGDVELMLNWPMTSYDKRIGLVYTPYMFNTWEQALEAYRKDGWLYNLLNDVYEENGLKFLGAWPEGFNGFATKGKYAVEIEQAKGIKLRVPPVFPNTEIVQALGYQAATIDWGELFTSIQTGVVDGDSSNVLFYSYEYFKDVMDHFVYTKAQFITGILSMNKEAWDKLSPEQQNVILQSAELVSKEQFELAKAFDDSIAQKWKDLGKKYIIPTEEQYTTMAKTVREKVWPVVEKELGAKTLSIIKDNAAQF